MRNLHLLALFTFSTTFSSLTGFGLAQVAAQDAPAQKKKVIRPGSIFLSGYYAINEAEKLEKAKLFKNAWNKYHQAKRYYETLANNFPTWKPKLVKMRIRTTQENIERLQPLAEKQHGDKQKKLKAYIAENTSENGIKSPTLTETNGVTSAERKRISELSSTASQYKTLLYKERNKHKVESEAMRRRIAKLEENLRKSQQGLLGNDSSQTKLLNGQINKLTSELSNYEKRSKADQTKLLKLLNELNEKRAKLAAAPLQKDVERLARERKQFEAELKNIVGIHHTHLKQYKELQIDRDKVLNDLNLANASLKAKSHQLEISTNASHKVVKSLRNQIKAQQAQITALNNQVAQLNTDNLAMKTRLADSEAINKELTENLASVTLERDKLSELLNLSDADRAKRTIKEALRLGQELREAQQMIKQLRTDKNAAQDQILVAQNKLAVAKSKIIKLQNQNTDYSKRIGSLEDNIKTTKAQLELAIKSPSSNPLVTEEAKALKKILQDFATQLERKKQAEKLLLEEYKKSGIQGSPIGNAIANLVDKKITLTDKESSYLKTKADTDKFRLPNSGPRTESERQLALSKAQFQVDAIESLAHLCIDKGSLVTAMEIYDNAYDTHGYHFPFFINRGVVRLKLNRYDEAEEIFESASQLKENSPYTHFMLGVCRFKNGKPELARKSLETAVHLRPDYAKAYIYLGNVTSSQGNNEKAKDYLEKAVRINPEDATAQFNLSYVHYLLGDKKAAKTVYYEALRQGLAPNLDFEKKLGIKKAQQSTSSAE